MKNLENNHQAVPGSQVGRFFAEGLGSHSQIDVPTSGGILGAVACYKHSDPLTMGGGGGGSSANNHTCAKKKAQEAAGTGVGISQKNMDAANVSPQLNLRT